MMDVFLVPVGRDRYECYFEAADDEVDEPAGQGFFARLKWRFDEQLREAERARHQKSIEEPAGVLGRWQKRSLRWMAERIAEQRLLWQLRKVEAATLHISDDLPADRANAIMRDSMRRDADRHRNRMIPHTLILIASGLVAIVPGPNLLAYLFTFTAVGHFLSWRGASHAVHKVAWTMSPRAELTDIHRAFALAPDARHAAILDAAERLRMPKMARFVEQLSAEL
ncbi:MAG: hypothetical protein ACKOEC_16450 [Acidimicrobiia bacterium]